MTASDDARRITIAPGDGPGCGAAPRQAREAAGLSHRGRRRAPEDAGAGGRSRWNPRTGPRWRAGVRARPAAQLCAPARASTSRPSCAQSAGRSGRAVRAGQPYPHAALPPLARTGRAPRDLHRASPRPSPCRCGWPRARTCANQLARAVAGHARDCRPRSATPPASTGAGRRAAHAAGRVDGVAAAAAAAQPALSLNFTGDSWVQVFAADGRTARTGRARCGQHRSYAAGEVARIVLGNVTAVEVQQAASRSTWRRSAARTWRALRYPLTVPSRRSPTDPRRGSRIPRWSASWAGSIHPALPTAGRHRSLQLLFMGRDRMAIDDLLDEHEQSERVLRMAAPQRRRPDRRHRARPGRDRRLEVVAAAPGHQQSAAGERSTRPALDAIAGQRSRRRRPRSRRSTPALYQHLASLELAKAQVDA